MFQTVKKNKLKQLSKRLISVFVGCKQSSPYNITGMQCAEINDNAVRARRPPPPPVQFTYRDLKRVDHHKFKFELALRRSSLFTAPADTANAFTTQLRTVVTELLDSFAPLKTVRCRARKPTSKWLSVDAVAAKRERRRLERVWMRSRKETDRVAYRAACRRANKLINSSRQEHIRNELDACTDSRQRWSTIKRLLHCNDCKKQTTPEDIGLCDKFSIFFFHF